MSCRVVYRFRSWFRSGLRLRQVGAEKRNGSGSCSICYTTAPAPQHRKRLRSRRHFFVFFATIHLNCDYRHIYARMRLLQEPKKSIRKIFVLQSSTAVSLSCRQLAREEDLVLFNYTFKYAFLGLKRFVYY
jgi:hypothetical protein